MENHLLFDVLLHLGTLAAVFLAFRGEISPLWNEGLRMLHLKKTRRGEEPGGVKRRMIWFLIAATLPLALAAVLNKYVESLYQNTFFIGFAFLMTGVLLFAADRMGHGNKNERGATLGDCGRGGSGTDDRGRAGLCPAAGRRSRQGCCAGSTGISR